MSGDTSPLSSHWARYTPPGPTLYERIDYAPIAAQLSEELDYVEAGELNARLVLCRYTGRQLIGVACHWGLLSEASRRLDRLRRAAGLL